MYSSHHFPERDKSFLNKRKLFRHFVLLLIISCMYDGLVPALAHNNEEWKNSGKIPPKLLPGKIIEG